MNAQVEPGEIVKEMSLKTLSVAPSPDRAEGTGTVLWTSETSRIILPLRTKLVYFALSYWIEGKRDRYATG
jgi:hypothetical protein